MSERTGLPDEVKIAIVQALACFDTPSEVARTVKDGFDLVVSRQAVEVYDPTKQAGAALGPEMRAIFEATRARFLAETAAIGVSHRAVRLRRLQRLADKAEAMGSIAMAAKLLEQAAREMGGTFTNSLAVSGDGQGAPIQQSIAIRFVRAPSAQDDTSAAG